MNAGSQPERADKFKKDEDYEKLLEAINESFLDYNPPNRETLPNSFEHPLLFIVGPPRSGTTLLYQLLAETRALGYCSNLMARFYRKPVAGHHLQKLLAPLLERSPMTWKSEFGQTSKWYEPHEFGYFWEHHFPFDSHHQPSTEQLESVSWHGLKNSLLEMQLSFDKPLVFKNPLLDFVIGEIADRIERVRVIEIVREPLAVAASLYRAREDFYGNPQEWYSTKPDDWQSVRGKTPEQQISHQLRAIQFTLKKTREALPSTSWYRVTYSQLCQNPHRILEKTFDYFEITDSPVTEGIPKSFPYAEASGPRERLDRLEEALIARGLKK
jgi:hypothetical protein